MLSLAAALFAMSAASHVAAAQEPSKKAIYILPGIMGSQIYTPAQEPERVWVGAGIVSDVLNVLLGKNSVMAHSQTGLGMAGGPDRARDQYGALNMYESLVRSVRAAAASGKQGYEVEFFPYNWVDDIHQSAKLLEQDIASKGYGKVTFIAHGNGGDLFAAFLARGASNAALVERAVLVSAPILGAVKPLLFQEDYNNILYDRTFGYFFSQASYSFAEPVFRTWLRSWLSTSPNMHQSFPGPEYVFGIPPLFKQTATSAPRPVSDMDEFYGILGRSAHINEYLVTGTARSAKHYREETLGGDVFSLLDAVDVVMVGTEYGIATPVNVVYRASGDRTILDDVIFTKEGDGFVPTASMDGRGRFPFVGFRDLNHMEIIQNRAVLAAINQIALGTFDYGAGNVTMPGAASARPAWRDAWADGSDSGMSEMVKVQLKSTGDASMVVYDDDGYVVAKADAHDETGFSDSNEIAFVSLPTEDGVNQIVYMPAAGYRVEFVGGRAGNGDATVTVSTLDRHGFYVSQKTYGIAAAGAAGGDRLLEIDVDGNVVQPSEDDPAGAANGAGRIARGGNDAVGMDEGNGVGGKDEGRVPAGSAGSAGAAGATGAGQSAGAAAGAPAGPSATRTYDTGWSLDRRAATLTPSHPSETIGVKYEAGSSPPRLAWYTSDPSVATVSRGVVTAIGPGNAVVTAVVSDGSLKWQSCEITVIGR